MVERIRGGDKLSCSTKGLNEALPLFYSPCTAARTIYLMLLHPADRGQPIKMAENAWSISVVGDK